MWRIIVHLDAALAANSAKQAVKLKAHSDNRHLRSAIPKVKHKQLLDWLLTTLDIYPCRIQNKSKSIDTNRDHGRLACADSGFLRRPDCKPFIGAQLQATLLIGAGFPRPTDYRDSFHTSSSYFRGECCSFLFEHIYSSVVRVVANTNGYFLCLGLRDYCRIYLPRSSPYCMDWIGRNPRDCFGRRPCLAYVQ